VQLAGDAMANNLVGTYADDVVGAPCTREQAQMGPGGNTQQAHEHDGTGIAGCYDGAAALSITWKGDQHGVESNSPINLTRLAPRGVDRGGCGCGKNGKGRDDDRLSEHTIEKSW
jgi:hypothetical protein